MIVSSILLQRTNSTTHGIEKYDERFELLCLDSALFLNNAKY
jgi:hypothetical protein